MNSAADRVTRELAGTVKFGVTNEAPFSRRKRMRTEAALAVGLAIST